MIGGTARPNPEASLVRDEHLCPRCGIQYRDTSARWQPVAPCRDCRPEYEALDKYRTAAGRKRPSQAGKRRRESREQLDRKNAQRRRRRLEAREEAA